MSSVEHLRELHGLPAVDFLVASEKGALPEPDAVAWRLAVDLYGEHDDVDYAALWARFLERVDVSRVRALIIGSWGEAYQNDSSEVIEPLVAARERLTALEAVFIGDLEFEEAEISWIEQSDVTPVLDAFPRLREFGIRGGTGLRLFPVRHGSLRRLVLQSGGLPGEVVRAVAACELPALEHLELWLGVDSYGGDAAVADLAPLLAGGRFPALRHLGLQDSELQDEIAAAVAAAPVVAQLESLSLSMGTLTDAGAEALLAGQPLTHLRRLDLHHHFLSEAMMERLNAEFAAGTELDLSEREKPSVWDDEEHRFVAVSE